MKPKFLPVLVLGIVAIALGACDDRAPLDPQAAAPASEGVLDETPVGDPPRGEFPANHHREILGEFAAVNVAVGGVGLFAQPATLSLDVPVPKGGTIRQAWFYWSGRSLFPVSDDTIVIDGVEHTGTLLSSFEHSVSPRRFAFLYKMDATDLVAAGANSFEISGFDMGLLGRPNGIGLVVVYDDAEGYADVQLMELADFFYWADVDAGNGGVHAFEFDASAEDRDAALTLLVGDGEPGRPDALWWTVGAGEAPETDLVGVATAIPDVLVSGVGEQFDVVSVSEVPVEAGAEHLAFQMESPEEGNGDSGMLSLAILCLTGTIEPNEPPVCDAGGPYAGDVDEEIVLDGSGSSDGDGTVVTWEWDFGDGATATGVTAAHAYAEAGTYTVTLCVVDDGGLESCCETTVEVAGVEIVCDAGGPYEGTAGEEVTFDASGTIDPDEEVAFYEWSFGDGSFGSGLTTAHTYAEPGEYTVVLCLYPDEPVRTGKGEEICCETTATIGEAPNADPTCAIGEIFSGDIFPGDEILFDGSGSSDSDGSVTAWEWDFGDGATASGETATHAWSEAGDYLVELCVTDDDEAVSCCSVEITVLALPNEAPVCDGGYGYEGVYGVPILFDGSGSYDPDGEIVSWFWDFGDGSTGEGETVEHTYTLERAGGGYGYYDVSLHVTDDAGESTLCWTMAYVYDVGDPDAPRASTSGRVDE
jgi:PKD repeat protein